VRTGPFKKGVAAMDRTEAIAWVLSICTGVFRKSQAKTLSVLVAAALVTQRVSLANLGRNIASPSAAKHQIKRVYRFVANPRIEVSWGMAGVLKVLLKRWRRGYKNKPLLVSFDWTDIRGLQVLMAAAVVKGRSIPLVWASCPKYVWKGHKSRNGFEESLLLLLRALIPKELGIQIVILADRGFGRTELGRFCQHYGFHYVIRIQPKVKIQVGSLRTRLDLYPVFRGICRRLDNVLYRAQDDPLTQHVIIRWKKSLPKKRDECWYLMTDLPQSARYLSDLYAKRMEIEEFFRDAKNKRNGWSLRDTGISDPERLDRLILILAIAYWFLIALGLAAQKRYQPRAWCSNNRVNTLSAFGIGQWALNRLRLHPDRLMAILLRAVAAASEKWG
jgi:hypothetical protein